MQTQTTSANPPTPRKNTRRARRQAPKGSTRVRAFRNALGLGPNIAVSVLDVSETGVRLILKENLATGQEFEINLESVAGSRTVKLIGTVVWSVEMANGQFCVGVQFAKTMGYNDLSVMARS